jgi:hypothetical protein
MSRSLTITSGRCASAASTSSRPLDTAPTSSNLSSRSLPTRHEPNRCRPQSTHGACPFPRPPTSQHRHVSVRCRCAGAMKESLGGRVTPPGVSRARECARCRDSC